MKKIYKFGFILVLALIVLGSNATPARAHECVASVGKPCHTLTPHPALVGSIKQLRKSIIDSSETYNTASADEKSKIQENLKGLIEERKSKLLKLAKENPQEFLNNVLTEKERSAVPSNLKSEIEAPSVINATLETYHIDDPKNKETEYRYFLDKGSERLEFYPTDNELLVRSGAKVKISGYKLDNIVVAGVNKTNLEITDIPPPIEATGDQRTLVILVGFLDSASAPFSRTEAERLIFHDQMQNFYNEASYGQVSFSGDVIGWITENKNKINDEYNYCTAPIMYDSEVVNAISTNHINLANYGRVLFLVNSPCTGGFSSVGKFPYSSGGNIYTTSVSTVYTGENGSYARPSDWGNQPFDWTNLDYVTSHELGHALGVWHANSWHCAGQDILQGDCYHVEYGNSYDVMGGTSFSLHFNAFYKDVLGWLSPESILTINHSGEYTINTLESNSGVRAAKISNQTHPNEKSFYLEYRKAVGFDSRLNDPEYVSNQTGLLINWIHSDFPFPRLLDMTPEFPTQSLNGYFDSPTWGQASLNQGAGTFQDTEHGITIGPIIRTTNSTITFNVSFQPAVIVRPSAPTNLFATSISSSEIDLSWIASPSSNIGGYIIYRGGEEIARTYNSNDTNYRDMWLESDTSYTYTVSAYSATLEDNNSAPSNSSSATTFIRNDLNNDRIVDERDFTFLRGVIDGVTTGCPQNVNSWLNPCDLNYDGNVDVIDLTTLKSYIINIYDYDYSGSLTSIDLEYLIGVRLHARVCPDYRICDLNHDGAINANDLRILRGIIQTGTFSPGLISAYLDYASSTSQQFVAVGTSGVNDFTTRATYNFSSTGNTATIKELRFTVDFINNRNDTVTAVRIGDVTAPVVDGVVSLTGLNIAVPNGSAGINQDIFIAYSIVGANGVPSGSYAGIALEYIKYEKNNGVITTTCSGFFGICDTTLNASYSPVMRLVASKPTLTLSPSNAILTGGAVDVGHIIVTADPKGNITLNQLPIEILNPGVAIVNQNSPNNIVVKNASGVVIPTTNTTLSFSPTTGRGLSTINFPNGYLISAGASQTFKIFLQFGTVPANSSVSLNLGAQDLLSWTDTAGGSSTPTTTDNLYFFYNYPTNIVSVESGGNTLFLGDVDFNGVVKINDALKISLHIEYCASGQYCLTGQALDNADVDGDGILTANDSILVAHFAGGLINTFPRSTPPTPIVPPSYGGGGGGGSNFNYYYGGGGSNDNGQVNTDNSSVNNNQSYDNSSNNYDSNNNDNNNYDTNVNNNDQTNYNVNNNDQTNYNDNNNSYYNSSENYNYQGQQQEYVEPTYF